MEKAKTLQEKLGFIDDDIKNPKHDDLVCWIDENAESIIHSFHWPSIEDQLERLRDTGRYSFDIKLKDLPERPPISIHAKKWELPIIKQQYKTETIVGFVDICIECLYPELYFTDKFWYRNEIVKIYFEAKTEIRSLGELLRQINTYKTYATGKYIVVCPDEKFKTIIKSQGIKFINPNSFALR